MLYNFFKFDFNRIVSNFVYIFCEFINILYGARILFQLVIGPFSHILEKWKHFMLVPLFGSNKFSRASRTYFKAFLSRLFTSRLSLKKGISRIRHFIKLEKKIGLLSHFGQFNRIFFFEGFACFLANCSFLHYLQFFHSI